jgi:hypothetical protein
MRHRWDYGASNRVNARSRKCRVCWVTGTRYGTGSSPWLTTSRGGVFLGAIRVPPCEGTPWIRHEFGDKSVAWELPSAVNDLMVPVKVITPGAIARYGRKQLEASLAEQNLPPLPEEAWKVLAA